jgi:hypothetical protein
MHGGVGTVNNWSRISLKLGRAVILGVFREGDGGLIVVVDGGGSVLGKTDIAE